MSVNLWRSNIGLSVAALLLTLSSLAAYADDDIQERFNRLHQRIKFGVSQGTITDDQAAQLRQSLDDIKKNAESMRAAGSGSLKPADLASIESQLNEKANLIRSYNKAGERQPAGAAATGPAWQPGADGAQNPHKLKQKMKQQEKTQLRQFDQAMTQVKEQQQQEYEKEMLQKLGSQRPAILNNKQDLEKVRESTGAN